MGTRGGKGWWRGLVFVSRLAAQGARIRPGLRSETLFPPQGARGSARLGEVNDDGGAAGGWSFWRPGPRRPARRRRPVAGARAEAWQVPPGAEADWQVREWVGKAGAGPGAAGGCGPASPPPPRDYLVPAAAMSPGRNVPPQIMLFISLGGSAARQHQAPGGRCARSPVLPSSPCAAAAPGLGVAAATAPAQVSPGGPIGRRGLGADADARGWGARRQRGRGAGPRGRVTWVAQGAGWGLSPGCGAWGPGGPGGCGSEHPGARESAWASEALGESGALLWRAGSWSVAPGLWEGGGGRAVSVQVPGHLLQDPGVGQRGFCFQRVRASRCPLCLLPPGFSPRGRSNFLLGNLSARSPGSLAPRQGGQDRSAKGPDPRTLGTTQRV